jgi:hypothetical protein
MSSSGSVRLRYEKCLQVWGNAKQLHAHLARQPAVNNLRPQSSMSAHGVGGWYRNDK